MRKWSKQGFLNPADSNDDGWYKFSIRPKKTKWNLGLGIQYIISDCSNKIYLEFEPNYVQLSDDGGMTKPEEYKAVNQSVADRVKKNRDFAAAVAKAAEMIEKNLLDFGEDLDRAFDIAQSRE
jgi:hypothetical protein